MYSISLARIAHKVLALVAGTGVVLALTTGPVLAGHGGGLHIDAASWDGGNLTANGEADKPKKDQGGDVEVFDADIPPPNNSLGLASLSNNGNWTYVGATCADNIYVTQDGVRSPTAGGHNVGGLDCDTGVNVPPILNSIGDRSVTEGNDLTITVSASDQDNDPADALTITWNGVPAGANFTYTYDGAGTGTGTGTLEWLNAGPAGSYQGVQFTASDGVDTDSEAITITVDPVVPPGPLPIQTDFKMMMNYELGMHCTGFEFAYCCVLPVYNSILAQVVKPASATENQHPRLLDAGHADGENPDVLGREIVLRDPDMDSNGNFQKYVLKYWHDAQPRGNQGSNRLISKVEGNTLLSWNTIADAAALDGDSAFELGTYNGATNVVQGNGILTDVDLVFGTPVDNYQNAVWNHLYIYEGSPAGVEGVRLCVDNTSTTCFTDQDCTDAGAGDVCGDSKESNKIRLGLHLGYPENFGPAGHNMEGLLTYSGEHGTVVYTAMKVLENLPITLTSPRIWEALGLPLTPFEDDLGFFADPGAVGEDSIRPFVEMKAQLYHYDPAAGDGRGAPVKDHNGDDVIGFGTAPIDIPNCERCHSAAQGSTNSPNTPAEWALVQEEMNFWKAYYPSMQTGEDWYARLKGAAISILARHDNTHGTEFTKYYGTSAPYGAVNCVTPPTPQDPNSCDGGPLTAPVAGSVGDVLAGQDGSDPRLAIPQNTRLGHESVICQKCHADNVIAVVKSANCGPDSNCSITEVDQLFSNIVGGYPAVCTDGDPGEIGNACAVDSDCDGTPPDPAGVCEATGEGHLILPLTEAIHHNHRSVSEGGQIAFSDAEGRNGGCQGCHPAHRSDGVMVEDDNLLDRDRYPITLDGDNAFALADNRDAAGGCFVGRDVHSNPYKDQDGAETPSHLNPTGQWLADNVFGDPSINGPGGKGIWCTNCHSQAGQELWRAENVADLVHAQPGDPGHVREPGGSGLSAVVAALNAATVYDIDPITEGNQPLTVAKYTSWLDPKGSLCSVGGNACANDGDCTAGSGDTCEALSADGEDNTHAIWKADPGMCSHVGALFGGPVDPAMDAGVATIEIELGDTGGAGCSNPGIAAPGPDCGGATPAFWICGSQDADLNFSVNLASWGLTSEDGSGAPCEPDKDEPGYDPDVECFEQTGFCTTDDCVAAARAKPGIAFAVPVPYSAATDGRDHWLSGGEPHCADCHAAPYTEQSGNINAFAPFNYPRKASLMRYSRGHQDITCQGCHESIHGLYPVTPPQFSSTGTAIDSTSYAQAASLNADGSHGPLKCGTCHRVDSGGIPIMKDGTTDKPLKSKLFGSNFDEVVTWMHTYTEEASPLDAVCKNCHGDRRDKVSATKAKWLRHGMRERITRKLMDKAELEILGHVAGDPDANGGYLPYEPGGEDVCTVCHEDQNGPGVGFETLVSCTDTPGAQCDVPSCSDPDATNCIGPNQGCNGTLWKRHLSEDRLPEKVWVAVSEASQATGNTTCGW